MIDKDARIRELEAVLRLMLDSAFPNEKEHPTMCAAWRQAKAALAGASPKDESAAVRAEREACAKIVRDMAQACAGHADLTLNPASDYAEDRLNDVLKEIKQRGTLS